MSRQLTIELWRERLEDFASSECSVQEWRRFNGVPVHQYYYWKRRLGAIDAKAADTPTTSATPHPGSPRAFASLRIIEDTPGQAQPGITLRIAGAAIELQHGFDPHCYARWCRHSHAERNLGQVGLPGVWIHRHAKIHRWPRRHRHPHLIDTAKETDIPLTFGPNGVLARTTATRTLLYALDALGNVSQQVDAVAGTVVATYLFDAWGARQVNSSDPTATSDPYSGYNCGAGYITEWETGLQLLGHRYYDPATGRFLNRDPIGMAESRAWAL